MVRKTQVQVVEGLRGGKGQVELHHLLFLQGTEGRIHGREMLLERM